MKIVINDMHGGFSLSDAGIEHYAKLKGFTLEVRKTEWGGSTYYRGEKYFDDRAIERNDPDLIETVETLKEKADGFCANLKIVEIPDDVQWQIQEYDGLEWVAEQHRTWA
jgi:hypothetical protein